MTAPAVMLLTITGGAATMSAHAGNTSVSHWRQTLRVGLLSWQKAAVSGAPGTSMARCSCHSGQAFAGSLGSRVLRSASPERLILWALPWLFPWADPHGQHLGCRRH